MHYLNSGINFIVRHILIIEIVIAMIMIVSGIFLFSLQAPTSTGTFTPVIFQIAPGEGFREVATALEKSGLVKNEMSFAAYAVFSGNAWHFHEGTYYITAPASVPHLSGLFAAPKKEVTVRISEGSTVRDVDRILFDVGVIPPGSMNALNAQEGIEGHLFPDTYQFYVNSDPQDVLKKFLDNFKTKAMPILSADKTKTLSNLILASLLEKEVPDLADQEIVAGILKKRIAQSIPLQIDATVCYVKAEILFKSGSCYPLAPADFQIDSPYNTYRVKGLPPGPIGSPSTQAIKAAMSPKSSPYLYYLSDPKTGKTIFAKTLEEQNINRAKYLK